MKPTSTHLLLTMVAFAAVGCFGTTPGQSDSTNVGFSNDTFEPVSVRLLSVKGLKATFEICGNDFSTIALWDYSLPSRGKYITPYAITHAGEKLSTYIPISDPVPGNEIPLASGECIADSYELDHRIPDLSDRLHSGQAVDVFWKIVLLSPTLELSEFFGGAHLHFDERAEPTERDQRGFE